LSNKRRVSTVLEPVAEKRLAEHKLWLILFQIKALRTRLNLLAFQYWLFSTLAALLAMGGLIYGAAVMMRPLAFLTIAVIAIGGGVIALVRVMRGARRQGADLTRAAMLADQRAGLKGRLATVLALADAPPGSSLWPYLVEDTYGLRNEFDPSRIEPRWVSRSVLALAAVCLLIAAPPLALRFGPRPQAGATSSLPAEVTADLNNLDIEPADPALEPNARLYADAKTLRQLQAKMAETDRQTHDRGGLSRWMNQARNLAGDLQDQVAGRKPLSLPPLHLNLTGRPNANDPNTSDGPSTAARNPSNSSGAHPGQGAGDAPNGQPQAPSPAGQDDQMASNEFGVQPSPGAEESGPGLPQSSQNAGRDSGNSDTGVTGSTHAGGTDPEHLFGPPTPQQLGSDSFKVTLEAVPTDEASSPGAPAYIPPKMRVPLNSNQAPDEPLSKTDVPPEDRMTIKRVFER
jgi:hypothetical protein